MQYGERMTLWANVRYNRNHAKAGQTESVGVPDEQAGELRNFVEGVQRANESRLPPASRTAALRVQPMSSGGPEIILQAREVDSAEIVRETGSEPA
ncbi:hypothetical protein [Actinomycetospora sp. CA-053990]|uniref:hypothetical protein n=1 Tax=Actinomycetospora sp. CA-053990 TaxID=3239891 RepID=UPI003D931F6A